MTMIVLEEMGEFVGVNVKVVDEGKVPGFRKVADA
jgi:hypothetical protein